MLSAPLRRRLKGLLGNTLWPFPTSLATRRLIRDDQGLVLTFHYIGAPILGGVGEDLFMPLPEFRRVLDFIAARLRPLAPPEFLRRLREGTLPERATLITFDDCLHDTCVKAFPELARRGLAACFFCCPGLMADDRGVPSLELMWMCASAAPGRYRVRPSLADTAALRLSIDDHASRVDAYSRLWPEILRCPSRSHAALLAGMRSDFGLDAPLPRRLRLADWNTLATLDEGGMTIGNHTMLHSTVTADSIDQFEADVALAFDMIERRIGPRPRVFCYPYGRKVDQAHGAEQILKKLRTEFAFVTQGGIASPRRSGVLNLHREDASYNVSATKLAPLLAFLR
jgi:peptidoglycan/xylan/chitin deacetylase (PgdA/CDA1 family)